MLAKPTGTEYKTPAIAVDALKSSVDVYWDTFLKTASPPILEFFVKQYRDVMTEIAMQIRVEQKLDDPKAITAVLQKVIDTKADIKHFQKKIEQVAQRHDEAWGPEIAAVIGSVETDGKLSFAKVIQLFIEKETMIAGAIRSAGAKTPVSLEIPRPEVVLKEMFRKIAVCLGEKPEAVRFRSKKGEINEQWNELIREPMQAVIRQYVPMDKILEAVSSSNPDEENKTMLGAATGTDSLSHAAAAAAAPTEQDQKAAAAVTDPTASANPATDTAAAAGGGSQEATEDKNGADESKPFLPGLLRGRGVNADGTKIPDASSLLNPAGPAPIKVSKSGRIAMSSEHGPVPGSPPPPPLPETEVRGARQVPSWREKLEQPLEKPVEQRLKATKKKKKTPVAEDVFDEEEEELEELEALDDEELYDEDEEDEELYDEEEDDEELYDENGDLLEEEDEEEDDEEEARVPVRAVSKKKKKKTIQAPAPPPRRAAAPRKAAAARPAAAAAAARPAARPAAARARANPQQSRAEKLRQIALMKKKIALMSQSV